jgi:hypothetical protein
MRLSGGAVEIGTIRRTAVDIPVIAVAQAPTHDDVVMR